MKTLLFTLIFFSKTLWSTELKDFKNWMDFATLGYAHAMYWQPCLNDWSSCKDMSNQTLLSRESIGGNVTCDIYLFEYENNQKKWEFNIWSNGHKDEIITVEVIQREKSYVIIDNGPRARQLKNDANAILVEKNLNIQISKNILSQVKEFDLRGLKILPILKKSFRNYLLTLEHPPVGRVHLFVGPFKSSFAEIEIYCVERKSIFSVGNADFEVLMNTLGLITKEWPIHQLAGQDDAYSVRNETSIAADTNIKVSHCIIDGMEIDIDLNSK